jgi:pimeloyl-ACP methyl ester carboxylesterase
MRRRHDVASGESGTANALSRRMRGTAVSDVEPSRAGAPACALSYQTAGQGPPLILLHGMTGSARSWRTCMRLLSRRFTVYAIDFHGFGDSRGGSFALRHATRCVEEFMDHRGIGRASLLGHSMGAVVAAELAARSPDRVDRLVLVAPPLLGLRRPLLEHARQLLGGLRAVPIAFLPALLSDLLRAGPATIWRAARDLLLLQADDIVAALRTPTLLVWGDRDTVVPVRLGRRLAALLPSSELVVLPGASHAPMWDAPRSFVRLVVRYLSSRA